uniref:Secreted protein n=1 Tax=Trichuris muris TaxID=70415 RepID=A0A5S6QBX8_TRIMR
MRQALRVVRWSALCRGLVNLNCRPSSPRANALCELIPSASPSAKTGCCQVRSQPGAQRAMIHRLAVARR